MNEDDLSSTTRRLLVLGIVATTVLSLLSNVWLTSTTTASIPAAMAQPLVGNNIFPPPPQQYSGPILPQQQQQQTVPPGAVVGGQQSDPELQRINQIVNGCKTTVQRMYPGAKTAQDVDQGKPQSSPTLAADYQQMRQCNQLLNQADALYCNSLQTYDAAKCTFMRNPEITNLIDMTAAIVSWDFIYDPLNKLS